MAPTPVITGCQAISSGPVPQNTKTPGHIRIRVNTEDGPMDVNIASEYAREFAETIFDFLDSAE